MPIDSEYDKWKNDAPDPEKPKLRKPRWTCPHCQSTAKMSCCTTCTREMCEECISDDPEIGPVCGLCYDRKYRPEQLTE
jgi:hypothetical protein